LQAHDLAVRWAKVNRKLLAKRFAEALGCQEDLLWDGCHNSITPAPGEPATLSHRMGEGLGVRAWVHRKGAVAADGEFVVIPGSRGSLS
jgi:release factor H-coupled RctB family protein